MSVAAGGALCRPQLGARGPRCHWGREQPPGLDRVDPDPGPEGCSRPDVGAGMARGFSLRSARRCTRVVARELAADRCRNALCFSTIILVRTSAISVNRIELCSAPSGSRCARPAGYGLDGASAQLEGRTYVMADEARPHFYVDQARRQSYREDLVGAIVHPSAVPLDSERCSHRSQSYAFSPFNSR